MANLAVRAVQVRLRPRAHPFLNRHRSPLQLAAIDLAAAEFVPQPEESGVLGQRIAAESLTALRLVNSTIPSRWRFRCAQPNCPLPEGYFT